LCDFAYTSAASARDKKKGKKLNLIYFGEKNRDKRIVAKEPARARPEDNWILNKA
jgi:hypothetical protein